MAVLEQRAAPHGNGRLGGLEEGEEVGNVFVGKLGTQEVAQDVLVGGVAQGHGIEVVGVHELVEHVGTEHHGFGNAHFHALQLVEVGMALDDVVEEGQSAPFSAQRAVADACEVAVGVEAVAVEERHHADVLHAAVLHNGVENNLAVGIHVFQLVPRHRLEERRHGEDGAGGEPAAHVVARDVVEHAVVGNVEDVVLQLLEVSHAHHLLVGGGVAEDEVAEAEVLGQDVAQVDVHLLRILVHIPDADAHVLGFLAVHHLGALHDERNVFVALADGAEELEAGLGILHHGLSGLAMHGEAAIANHAKRIVVVFVIELPGLVVGACQHHLRPAPHAQGGAMGVQRLGGEALALRQYIAVEVGQHRGIVPDAVFHQ